MEGRSAPAVLAARRRRDEAAKAQREAAAEAETAKRPREADEGTGGGDGLNEERRTRARVQLMKPAVAALPPPPRALQRLVHACRAVFRGSETAPPPATVSLICGLLDEMGPDDVGLRTEVFFNKMNTAAGRQNPPVITCKNLYECDNFTIAVFFMPQGAVMPLHDHPGMTVFSKLLLGSAHVTSYDWIHPSIRCPDDRSAMMLAKKVLDHGLTAASGSTSWVLYPNAGGNMHRFAAGKDSPCAFVDVLAPPYSLAQRRVCNFYQDFPYDLHPDVAGGVNLTEEQKRRLAWLQQTDTPKDLRICTLPYPAGDLLDADDDASYSAAAQGRSLDNN